MVLIAPHHKKLVARRMKRQLQQKVKKMRKAQKLKSRRNPPLIWTLRIPLIRSQPSYELRFPRCL